MTDDFAFAECYVSLFFFGSPRDRLVGQQSVFAKARGRGPTLPYKQGCCQSNNWGDLGVDRSKNAVCDGLYGAVDLCDGFDSFLNFNGLIFDYFHSLVCSSTRSMIYHDREIDLFLLFCFFFICLLSHFFYC